jgi:hypothetical protein
MRIRLVALAAAAPLLLATAEQLLHLPRLGLASAFATMTAAFRL